MTTDNSITCVWVVLNDDKVPVAVLPTKDAALEFYCEWQFNRKGGHVPDNITVSDWVDGSAVSFSEAIRTKGGGVYWKQWGGISSAALAPDFHSWRTNDHSCRSFEQVEKYEVLGQWKRKKAARFPAGAE